MSHSSDEWGVDSDDWDVSYSRHRSDSSDPYGIFSDDSVEQRIINTLLGGHDDFYSDDSVVLDDLDALRADRLPRRCATWTYTGDLFAAIEGTHSDPTKNWNVLPDDEVDRRWMTEFRMLKPDFNDLLQMVEEQHESCEPSNSKMRYYPVNLKLLVTLNFLAHVPTLRQMASKWGLPHCSIAVICLHPIVKVLANIFLRNEDTRNIKFPKEAEHLKATVGAFYNRYHLPGCAGAIDGSLIQQRKPTKQQANQDTDSYYGYKGQISTLLLAVCDADLRFTYVNAGAPGCVGDAGFFARSRLRERMDGGLLKCIDTPLKFADGRQSSIFPFLAGDAAFPLRPDLLKCHSNPAPQPGTPEAKFNKRLTNVRRLIEMAFGRLKGRWVCCSKNTFWNDVEFTRHMIEACCGLHNFCEERRLRCPLSMMPKTWLFHW
jgi:DDE superfamily endonuclease